MIKIIGLAIFLSGCAAAPTLSGPASKVQVIGQDSSLINKCKTIGPVSATKAAVMPAQDVLDMAEAEARERAAALGADAMSITNTDFKAGLKNTMTVQAVALKCY